MFENLLSPDQTKLDKIYLSRTIAKILLNPQIKLVILFIPLFDRLHAAINLRLHKPLKERLNEGYI